MTKKGKLDAEMFEGATINTPSLLAVEDYLDALKWGESIGGLKALHARADANAKVHARLGREDAVGRVPGGRSGDPLQHQRVPQGRRSARDALSDEAQAEFAKKLAWLLEKEGVALDAASYRAAPPGLRIWCGATIEATDVEALTPWIDWAFEACVADIAKAA